MKFLSKPHERKIRNILIERLKTIMENDPQFLHALVEGMVSPHTTTLPATTSTSEVEQVLSGLLRPHLGPRYQHLDVAAEIAALMDPALAEVEQVLNPLDLDAMTRHQQDFLSAWETQQQEIWSAATAARDEIWQIAEEIDDLYGRADLVMDTLRTTLTDSTSALDQREKQVVELSREYAAQPHRVLMEHEFDTHSRLLAWATAMQERAGDAHTKLEDIVEHLVLEDHQNQVSVAHDAVVFALTEIYDCNGYGDACPEVSSTIAPPSGGGGS